MKFTIIGAALAVASTANAAMGGVLICNGANATGDCLYGVYPLRQCIEVPEPFKHNSSTFAPDGDAFSCAPRGGTCDDICTSPTGCTFGRVSFYNPIKWDLGQIKWEKSLGNFWCVENATVT